MFEATERKRFSWLHFSDWHISTAEDTQIRRAQWAALMRDLSALHQDSGPWDAIFITGDLSYAGRPHEFSAFSNKLLNLLRHVWKLGSTPRVLTVPGNHDAAWQELPGGMHIVLALQSLLKNLSENDEVNKFLANYENQFRELIGQCFSHYRAWEREFSNSRWALSKPTRRGLFPGDFSTKIEVNGLKVGVVGLNTATADFKDGDLRGYRQLDVRQLKKVCGDEPDRWMRRNDFSILLTHHPPSQLEPESRTALHAEISPPGRFLFHLCGSARASTPVVRLQESPSLLIQAPATRASGDDQLAGYVAGSVQLDLTSYAFNLRPRRYDHKQNRYLPDPEYDPALLTEYRHTYQRMVARGPAPVEALAPESAPVLERVELINFRSFKRLALNFKHESKLPGHWTCLAGINGAGKSSILQALCMILIGEPLVSDLGSDRLRRARRLNEQGEGQDAEMRAWVDFNQRRHFLEVKLSEPFVPAVEAEGYRRPMHDFWKMMRSRIVLAYGASRNLSDFLDTRYSNINIDVRRVMTLFDPLAQIPSAEVLLSKFGSEMTPVLRLFRRLLKGVFGGHLDVRFHNGVVRFTSDGGVVDALDLPDGFRSSVAWLADLCAVWCEKFPDRAKRAAPADIEAIVLIDEIDLHLHPSLQRILVPQLREVLPCVQWVVTTHSPLILSSFDSAEIVALDRREPGGVRFLDRQILGFTTSQIYNWLMDTPDDSAVMEKKLFEREFDPGANDEEVARLIEMSPEVSEAEAEERLRQRRELIKELESLNP